MEEALRQQAINRLQRRQNQAAADESLGDVEQAGTSSSAVLENAPAAAVPAPEMELVFKPHPKQLAIDNAIAAETRYIKTTANATGMNVNFEIILKSRVNVDLYVVVNTPLMCYWFLYICADFRYLALIQTPAYTARSRIWAIVSCNVHVTPPAFAGYSLCRWWDGSG